MQKYEVEKKPTSFECCEGEKKPDCSFEVKHTRYSDIKHTATYIYKNEGLGAFTKGVLPRMSINVPSTALSWGTYELIKSLLGVESNSRSD